MQLVGVILAIPKFLGPDKLALATKNESQWMLTLLLNKAELSLQLTVPFILKTGDGGTMMVVVKSADQPVQATLLSDLKCKVMQLSLLVMVPGPMVPLHLPRSVEFVSGPSKILNTSSYFSVQNELNFRVKFLAPGTHIVMVIFSL